jgi:dTMP kinase
LALFITFEGGEGCGKSSQARLLAQRLRRLAIPHILIREPGGTELGERIRNWLKKNRRMAISPGAELLLFSASRTELVSQVIRPALGENKIVVCDRFSDSTLAYQSFGRGLPRRSVEQINLFATGGLQPDLVFLLDMPPELALARKKPDGRDRFENEEIAFHERVRQGFLTLAAKEPERWVVLDAACSKARLAATVFARIAERQKEAAAK